MAKIKRPKFVEDSDRIGRDWYSVECVDEYLEALEGLAEVVSLYGFPDGTGAGDDIASFLEKLEFEKGGK